VFASVNAFIPASFKVERYVELELSEKQLYNYVRDLNHFKSWNPWFNLENAVTELQGQIGEKGSVLMITEGNLDSRIELAYLKPTNDVRFALDLPSHQSVESLYFLIERQENGAAKIVAGLKGKRSFPFRILNLMMNKGVGPQLEMILNKINIDLLRAAGEE
jgi:hypothetical protein